MRIALLTCFAVVSLLAQAVPDPRIAVEGPDFSGELPKAAGGFWSAQGVSVRIDSGGEVSVESSGKRLERVRLTWLRAFVRGSRYFCDAWERTEGDSGWYDAPTFSCSPWYAMVREPDGTFHGFGVEVQPSSLVCWKFGEGTLTAVLDVTAGGRPLSLGPRTLRAARLVLMEGEKGLSAFAAARKFAKQMCPAARLPSAPVYGYNDWYCAYGKNTATNFLQDAAFVCSLAEGLKNRPYVVMDDGWQPNAPPVVKKYNLGGSGWGPWDRSGDAFGMDMRPFAAKVRALGAKPGLWYRPYRAWAEAPNSLKCLNNKRIFDPTLPEVKKMIFEDVRRFRDWGFDLVKIDYLVRDLCGLCGTELHDRVFHDDRGWRDDTRTSAEVMLDLQRTMRAAAGDKVVLIGCNALNHLAAGIFELQRTGNDTSGWKWEQTKRIGVNTLGARGFLNGIFYAADADCAGLAKAGAVPWEKNRQWIDLLGRSGTPLFVSWHRSLVDDGVRAALKAGFRAASELRATAEPLDWLENRVPARWRLADGEAQYVW